jgi:Tol biopolymer transport system component
MSLTTGTKLGPYEILAPIGAGGMGEVYRAKDTKLKREVALKVLPEAFAADPERMARFQREAEVLASLNHPNIAQIYGVEERALVMELVEGESPKGPMPFDEAWKIASQIAAGLEYAHDKGIIHRDLKPANIKITPDGIVKLLDFGLAKAFAAPAAVSGSPDNSPTLTLGATQLGVILGTAAYMAPEQAKGKAVDKRADIWSFGVVLYELLTGERLFAGDDVSDTLAQVLMKQPDLDKAPSQARRLLCECLQKDPKERLRDIGDARLQVLEGVPGREREARPASPPRRATVSSIVAWSLAAIFAIAAGVSWVEAPAPDNGSLRYSIDAPADTRFVNTYFNTAISPDGRLLAFGAARTGADITIWVRPMNSLAARELPGTNGGNGPFWSPDSKSIAFVANNQLKRIDVLGGSSQLLCDAPGFQGGTWSRDGTILFSSASVIQRVSASGGAREPVSSLDTARQETAHLFPAFLPDGKSFLFTISSANENNQGIHVASLRAPNQRLRLVAGRSKAVYAPPTGRQPGYLLWKRDQTLVAQRFDGKARMEADPIPVAEEVAENTLSRASFWISDNGLLLYRTGEQGVSQLQWVSRDGKHEVLTAAGADGRRGDPRISPDGSRVVLARNTTQGAGEGFDIWTYEFARGVMTRLTFGQGSNGNPVWSPDGRQIAFVSDRGGTRQIYRKDSGGTGQDERLTSGASKYLTDWSRDGRYLLYEEQDPKNGLDIWTMPLEGDRKPAAFLRTQFDESHAQFSPDGKWVAYQSNESGSIQIYLQTFPPIGGKWQVSTGGGVQPRWRGDGREIYYVRGGRMWAASIRTAGGRVEIDPPHELLPIGFNTGPEYFYDVSHDGQRFLAFQLPDIIGSQSANPLTVVSNWQAGLKK